MIAEKAYVLLSGGQDSFACMIWAQENFKEVEAVSLNYGQRHNKELFYAKVVADHFNAQHTVYDLGDFFKAMTTSTLLGSGDHNTKHELASHLPASFVPNRNGLFLTVISNHAYKRGDKHLHLVTGTCETDYSGYPDCRDNYIKTKQIELSMGLDRPVSIHTPLMWLTKAQTFAIAASAGKLNEMIELTLTCYNGIENMNEWGRGCGECPSCLIRKNGYIEFKNKKK
jgi:7-cyano-7-deazaguanine synthase